MKRKVAIKDCVALIKTINFIPMLIFIQGSKYIGAMRAYLQKNE